MVEGRRPPTIRGAIVLVGVPGAGKTTVGRIIADRLGRALTDVDQDVHQHTGLIAGEHIERGGEAAFRAVEREAIERLVRIPDAVLATGGGSVIDPLNRWALSNYGTVVWLDASIQAASTRLRLDDVVRPMFAADPEASLERITREREPFYRFADILVDADQPPEAVADEILAKLAGPLPRWRVLFDAQVPRYHPIGPENARIVFGRDLDAAALARYLSPFEGRAPAVLLDRGLPRAAPWLGAAVPEGRRLEVVAGEAIKRMSHLEEVLEWMSAQGVERRDPLIVVGGGTVGDLGGMAAATYMRGIPLIQLPTTWLAMADAALGGKAAVDLARSKNAVGAFWPAWATIADVSALKVLPLERLRDGMAECLKMGIIGDPVLWQLIETRGMSAMLGEDAAARYAILERAARLKVEIVERDPYERGERRVLNLGHTLAHGLEVESGYQLAHGDAVALGLRGVAGISADRGADPAIIGRIDEVLEYLGFPLTRRFDADRVKQALRGDKKRDQGAIRWILPLEVGRVSEVGNVTESEIDSALMRIQGA